MTRSSAARVGWPGSSARSTVNSACARAGMRWGLPARRPLASAKPLVKHIRNGADAGAAALAVRLGCERPQPRGDRTGAVGQDGELARDADTDDRPQRRGRGERLAGRPNSDGRNTV